MTHIMGVVCDGCGKSDVISAQVANDQSIPRNNWISIYIWSGESKGVVRVPEIHACSGECLQTVTAKLVESATNAEKSDE